MTNLLEEVFKSKIEVCNYKLDNVKANLNTVRDDIESSQQLFDCSKTEMECKLLETGNEKNKATLENCKDTGHNICYQRVCELSEH